MSGVAGKMDEDPRAQERTGARALCLLAGHPAAPNGQRRVPVGAGVEHFGIGQHPARDRLALVQQQVVALGGHLDVGRVFQVPQDLALGGKHAGEVRRSGPASPGPC